MTSRTSFAILLIFGLLPFTSHARINRVPENFRTIQSAIDATRDGDTVVVDPGVYEENLVFNGHRIVVGSYILTIGGDVWIGETIIDGGGDVRVVSFTGFTEQSTLRGFTLRNGESAWGGGVFIGPRTRVVLEDLVITGNRAVEDGGGLYVAQSSPILERVVIRGNNADRGGGGAYFVEATPILIDCQIIQNRAAFGSGCFSETSDINMVRVLITNNVCTDRSGGVILWGGTRQGGNSFFDHLTISGNQCGDDFDGGLILDTESAEDITLTITNSIIWNNDGIEIIIRDGGNEWDGIDSVLASYCDIDFGQDSIEVGDHGGFLLGDGILEEEPNFVSQEEFDYRLMQNSPCIDAGNPDDDPDPDGSQTDMGALGVWQPDMILNGRVIDSETGEPIPFASGIGYLPFGFVILIECDSVGVWKSNLNMIINELTVRIGAVDYLPTSMNFDTHNGDSTLIVTRLDHAEFIAQHDTISAVLDSGEFEAVRYSIRNEGNGPLTWKSQIRNPNENGQPAFSIREQLAVTQITGDLRVEGTVFDGQNYYFAGANDNAPNMIWVVNREGELIDSMRQPGTSRYGFRDLEWDGEFIWGADNDTIFAIDRRGNVRRRWVGPDRNTSNIAFDFLNNTLLISGTVSDISRYDRDGNALGRVLSRQSMRIFGLGWLSDAPDSSNLMILNKSEGQPALITAMNPNSGDTLNLRPIGNANDNNPSGLFICQSYDRYAGSVMMVLQNLPIDQGGDRLDVIQIQSNRQWVTVDPASGVVAPGEESNVQIRINSSNYEYNWGLRGGMYTGDLVFSHDGRGGEFIVPIDLEVIGTSSIKADRGLQPSNASVTALYPLPFNSKLNIEYTLSERSEIVISLTDILGREVARMNYGRLDGGSHKAGISADDLGSGLYLLKLEGEFGPIGRKVVLIK